MPTPTAQRPAVFLTVRCLDPGCQLGEESSSTSPGMTDAQRLQVAEAHVWFCRRNCRTHHAAGVEARFSDDPRRIVFSVRRSWRRLWLLPSPSHQWLQSLRSFS